MFRLPLLLLLLPSLASAQASFTPNEQIYYGLIDRGSGRCLDIAGAISTSGAPAVQWEFTHANSQQWRFVPLRAGSEYFRIEARHSTQCLTLEKPDNNAPLVQRPFTGSEQQQWRLVPAGPQGSFQLENRMQKFCAGLAAADKFNGTPVQGQRPLGRASQQWQLFPLRLNVNAKLPAFEPPVPVVGGVNGAGNELHPVLSAEGQTMYFARTRFAGNVEGNADSGDAWVSQSADKGQTWSPAQRLDAVNTAQNNEVIAVAGSDLIVRGTYDRTGSFLDDGLSRVPRAAVEAAGATPKSVHPEKLRIPNYYSATPATGFFMSADGKILLLSLERGDSQGGNDLYLSQPDGAGGYTEPRSLGAVLNSPGYDFAPWLAPDGKTLYFASYGHMGYGSADVFVSERLDESWTSWSPPRNLGPTLNGPGFDAYFCFGPDGKTAYLAASKTVNATKDIYRTRQLDPLPADTVPAAPAPISEEARGMLSGRVLDARTRQPIPGAEVKANLLPNAQNVSFNATSRADNTGLFQMSLLAGGYRLTASGGGLFTFADTLRMPIGSRRRDILLQPAAVGEKVDLPSIIFAQGRAGLLAPSYAELNRLAIALQANPSTEIRLEGHTDNVGDPAKNQELSEARVLEVKRYLVSRGVDEKRISLIGFGGSKPRFDNKREETRKLNRRVEMVIVK